MRRGGSKLLDPEKSIDDEPLHAATPHGLEKPVAERVEDVLGMWVPEDLRMALLDQAVELDADTGRLMPQAQRRLVKAEKEPGLLGGRLREKMQTQARLSRTRGAEHERCRAARDTAAQHRVELVDAGGASLIRPLVSGRGAGEQRLDPGIGDDAPVRDPERAPAAQGVGAAELAYLQFPLGLCAEQHIVKLYKPVHHRVLGVVLVATTIGQKQRCATFDGYVGLQLVDELPELAIRPARFLGGDETVQDEQRRAMRPNLVPQ